MQFELEQECLIIIDELNIQLYENLCKIMSERDATEASSVFPFVFTSYGFGMSIELAGIPIWDSENDERELVENADGTDEDYENLKGFIINKVNSIMTIIGSIQKFK